LIIIFLGVFSATFGFLAIVLVSVTFIINWLVLFL
jgi:hypothetical protein